jgi:hypothetical protein
VFYSQKPPHNGGLREAQAPYSILSMFDFNVPMPEGTAIPPRIIVLAPDDVAPPVDQHAPGKTAPAKPSA